ncbi:hypothetical protein FRB99_002047, partial [Tulasnella sp. 403]
MGVDPGGERAEDPETLRPQRKRITALKPGKQTENRRKAGDDDKTFLGADLETDAEFLEGGAMRNKGKKELRRRFCFDFSYPSGG